MCGIIFAANFDQKKNEPVNEDVLNQFEDQASRGTSGFGLVFVQQDGSYTIKRSCNATKTIIDLYNEKNHAPIIMMHHRWPTSSANKIKETHPIEVDNGSLKYKYLITHNGIVNNDDEMKVKHEELGFVYTTIRKDNYNREEFNDSECLAIEVARLAEKQITEIETKGSMAFVAIKIDRKTDRIIEVMFGRNEGSPLKMSKTRGKIRISSEGEGEDIKPMTFYSFNLTDFKLDKKEFKIKEVEWRQYANMTSTQTTIISDSHKQKEDELTEEIDVTDITVVLDKIEELETNMTSEIDVLYEEEVEKISTVMEEIKNKIVSDKLNWIEDSGIQTITDMIKALMDKIKLIKGEHEKTIETIKDAAKSAHSGGPKKIKIKQTNFSQYDDDDYDPSPTQYPSYPIHSRPLQDPLYPQGQERTLGFSDY